MNKYAGLKLNDTVDGEGVCVSFWTQGCPHHCYNCHNPQTWDYDGGYDIPENLFDQIIQSISANGIQRNFSVLGGEPLCPENLEIVNEVITKVRKAYPNIKIYVWTGYLFEILVEKNNETIDSIFDKIDYIIDGPYIDKQRDITLHLCGSKNQRVIDVKKSLKNSEVILKGE